MMKCKNLFLDALRELFYGIGGDPGSDQIIPANLLLKWYEAEHNINLNCEFTYNNIHTVLECIETNTPMVISIKALDHMIDDGLSEYRCDPWCRVPMNEHFASLKDIKGQVNYKDEIFVVTHNAGSRGMGGMDQGSPESVSIIKIRQG